MSSKKFKARLQKRILLEAAALSLEIEESNELDDEYKEKFKKDFEYELRFLASKEEHSDEVIAPDSAGMLEKEEILIHPDIKKLFREIAKKTHPDIFGDLYEEEFKKANIAQEENDWISLLVIANDLNVTLPVFTDDIGRLIGEDMNKKREFLESRKDGLAWAWAAAPDSSEASRVAARKIMQINEEEFQIFLDSLKKNS